MTNDDIVGWGSVPEADQTKKPKNREGKERATRIPGVVRWCIGNDDKMIGKNPKVAPGATMKVVTKELSGNYLLIELRFNASSSSGRVANAVAAWV